MGIVRTPSSLHYWVSTNRSAMFPEALYLSHLHLAGVFFIYPATSLPIGGHSKEPNQEGFEL